MLLGLGTAGTTTFDIQKNGTTIYSTKPSIAFNASPTSAGFTSSANAGTLTPSPTPFAQYDLITIKVYTAGTGMTGGKCFIWHS